MVCALDDNSVNMRMDSVHITSCLGLVDYKFIAMFA